jgi:hypothetical protein
MGAAPRNRLGVASATLNTMRNVGMVCRFALSLAVAAAAMPPALVNEVFLGTVGHLPASIASSFTGAMSHAFIASALICLLATGCSVVRQRRRVSPDNGQRAEEAEIELSTRHAADYEVFMNTMKETACPPWYSRAENSA